MPEYNAPLRDMRFVMDELLDMTGSYAAYGLEDATPDLVSAILEEGAKFTNQVLSPLNRSGDEEGCHEDVQAEADGIGPFIFMGKPID